MARGVNKVILVGNLGKDPEVRHMPSGGAVANLTIATSENWKDKNTGENQERTEWHRVVMFGRLGEIAGEYLKKGSQVYLEGKLQTRKWQDQQGQDRYTTEIVANEMQMLGARGGSGGGDFGGGQGGGQSYGGGNQGGGQAYGGDNQGGSNQSGGNQGQGGYGGAPQGGGQQAPQQNQGGGNNNGFDDFDDDIPF